MEDLLESFLWTDVAEYSFLLVVAAAHSLLSFFLLFQSDEFSARKVAIARHSFDKLLVRLGDAQGH